MSPMTLHTCLQGPLSGEKPPRLETSRLVAPSSSLQAEGLGAKEPQPQSFPQGPLVNQLRHRLVSGTMFGTSHRHHCSDTKPLPGVTVLAERRGQRRQGRRERKDTEKEGTRKRGREEEHRELSTEDCKQSPGQFLKQGFYSFHIIGPERKSR